MHATNESQCMTLQPKSVQAVVNHSKCPGRSMNTMDSALHAHAKTLLEAKLGAQRAKGSLQTLRSKEEADVPAMVQRHRELHPTERQQSGSRKRMSQHHRPAEGALPVNQSADMPSDNRIIKSTALICDSLQAPECRSTSMIWMISFGKMIA